MEGDARANLVHQGIAANRMKTQLWYISFRRLVLFLDEWFFYLLVTLLWWLNAPTVIITILFLWMATSLLTGYLNLEALKRTIGIYEHRILWGLF